MLITARYLDYFFLFLLVDIKVVECMEIVIAGQIVCSLSLSRSVNFVPVQYLRLSTSTDRYIPVSMQPCREPQSMISQAAKAQRNDH